MTTNTVARLCLLLPALALAACTISTKIADEDDGGDGGDASDPQVTTGQPTGEPPPINGESTDEGGETNGNSGSCTPVKLMQTALSPNVVLLLDKSGSMVADPNGFWDHDADAMTPNVTRWSSLHEVVETIVTDFDDKINFGAHLYPADEATASYNSDACLVDSAINIAVAANNMDEVLAGIPLASDESLRGGTPASVALGVALDHLKTLDPEVPRAILLVTDGAANCRVDHESDADLFEDYDEAVHDVVGDAFSVDGIPTYVVGVGIEDVVSPTAQDGTPDATNAFDRLNELAEDGGKPRSDPDEKFYNTNNQLELAAALDEIAVDALTCILPLDPAPVDPKETIVALGGEVIPQVEDCQSESGWVYMNPDGPFDRIRMCGSACGGLKLTGSAEVTVCAVD